jgi:hypothetical protein
MRILGAKVKGGGESAATEAVGIEEAMHESVWQVLAEDNGDYGEWEKEAGTEHLLRASKTYNERESFDMYLSIILQAQEMLLRVQGRSYARSRLFLHNKLKHVGKSSTQGVPYQYLVSTAV